MTMTPESWARDLLTRMNYPITMNNMASVLSWEYAEGGHFANAAHYNPLNTTMAHAKYGSMNSAGVATYPNYETGMRETIATLQLPAYAAIRRDLKADAAPQRTTAAVAASPWGTWHGSSPAPLVERAKRELHAHPSWYASEKGKHGGHQHGGPKHGGNGGTGGGKVVLDLQELQRLSRVYQQASDEVLQRRRGIQDLAVSIDAARRALPDAAIANAIASTFAYLTDPQRGLDRDARLMDELSAYTAEVRRLAEEADADHNGQWSKAERAAFAKRHGGDASEPAMRAVLEALSGGRIVRTAKDLENGHTGNGTGRAAKIEKMLELAGKQHASEHNGDNRTKYGEWFGNNGQVWCADFASWVFWHSGNKLPAIQGPKGFAYVPYAINYARAHGQLHNTAHAGDIFLLKDGSHTGIVSKVYSNGTFDTVEGNHSNTVDRVQRNSHDGSYYFWTAIR